MNNSIKNTYIPKLRFKEFKSPFIKNNLCEVALINKGKQINNINLEKTGFYYYQNGGIEPSGWLNLFNQNSRVISISEGGESCGFVKWHNQPFWSGGHLYTCLLYTSPSPRDKF